MPQNTKDKRDSSNTSYSAIPFVDLVWGLFAKELQAACSNKVKLVEPIGCQFSFWEYSLVWSLDVGDSVTIAEVAGTFYVHERILSSSV